MDRRHYLCLPLPDDHQISADASSENWKRLPWTDDFVDILGSSAPTPRFRTRAKMGWNAKGLYVIAELEEPHVWGTLTEHDSVIFQDNDFEVFLDPDGDRQNYVELELNALNTTWDLLLPRTYWDGGPAINGYEIKGLETMVRVAGTLNDPSDEDRGWSTEILLPWKALKEVTSLPCPPPPGAQWRINFSRVQWKHEIVEGKYKKLPGPEDNWVWSPQGVVDMHRPEMWGVLEFSLGSSTGHKINFEEVDRVMAVYWAQKTHRQAKGSYAVSLSELGDFSGVTMTATNSFFEVTGRGWRVDSSGGLFQV